jgi:hypothetical protein
MIKPFLTCAVTGIAVVILGVASAQAASTTTNLIGNPMLIHVSGGCGPYGWRGPYGHCNYSRGRYWRGNGCPYGYWRGPWGHCRNTPYHGRLPNGGWK